jgi:hypothetical protein
MIAAVPALAVEHAAPPMLRVGRATGDAGAD